MTSALADRWVFAAWGLGVASGHLVLVRYGFLASWRGARIAAAALFFLAVSWVLLGWLTGRHQEALELGLLAFPSPLWPRWIFQRVAFYLVAAVLAAVSLLLTLPRRGAPATSSGN